VRREDVDALKKDVSRFVSNDESVDEKEMRVVKLTKHILAAIDRLSHIDHIEMSRINVFASSSCKKDVDDDVDDVEDVEDVEDDKDEDAELDDIFDRENVDEDNEKVEDNENVYDEDREKVADGRSMREIDPNVDTEVVLTKESLPLKHKSGIISNIFKDIAAKKTVNDIGGGDDSDDESEGEGYDFDEVFDDDE
jgi:hypothetical protein